MERVKKSVVKKVEKPIPVEVPIPVQAPVIEEEVPVVVQAPVAVQAEPVIESKLRWRKLGGGSIRCDIGGVKRIIKPGEIFFADFNELPKGSLDLLECLDKEGLKAAAVAEKAREPFVPVVYTLKKAKSKDQWDVVDSEGKALNEKSLSRLAAEELLNTINA